MSQGRAGGRIAAQFVLVLFLQVLFVSRVGAFGFHEVYRFLDSYPYPSGLVEGGDGAFYGTCQHTGSNGMGSVFRVGTNGALSTIASFNGTNGSDPAGGLVWRADGVLYGTASKGGSQGFGTIFRVTMDGQLSSLVSFTGTNGPNFGSTPQGVGLAQDGTIYGGTYDSHIFRLATDGAFTSLGTVGTNGDFVNGPLVEGPDGALYGTARSGGNGNNGTIFRVTPGGTVSLVHAFDGADGTQPLGRLLKGQDGALYGTTYSGGLYSRGTAFRCTITGDFTTVYDFDSGGGTYPWAGLVQDTDGILYGATQGGGPAYHGVVFSLTTNGSLTTLSTFNELNGSDPSAELVLAADGMIYGTTPGGGTAGAGAAFRMPKSGGLSTITTFRPGSGTSPENGLFQAADGRLYGTTSTGGSNGVGTAICVTTNGSLQMSVSLEPAKGATPSSPLFPEADGYYGLAERGGAQDWGSLYRVTTNGVLSLVGSFDYNNGAYPSGPLCRGADGAVYGTAYLGGDYGYGNVFRASTNGAITILVSFDSTHGSYPEAGVIRGRDGAFYGTCNYGGSQDAGTVFRVTTNGTLTTLASFNPAGNQGGMGRSTLVEWDDGAFYGTTYTTSSNHSGYGTVFRVTTNGTFSRITTFISQSDPHYPKGPLVIGPDGALYGTTISGGLYGTGTIFRVMTNGAFSTLVSFWGYYTGEDPLNGVIFGQDGRLYGTTPSGQGFAGNVFAVELSSSLRPPVVQGSARVLGLSGMPRVGYRVQRATKVTGPWSSIATVTLDFAGNGQYTDNFPPAGAAFYRLMVR